MKAFVLMILLASIGATAVQFQLIELPPSGLQVYAAARHLDHSAIEASIARYLSNNPLGALGTRVRMAAPGRVPVNDYGVHSVKLPFFFATADAALFKIEQMLRLKTHLDKEFAKSPAEENPADFQILALKPNPAMQRLPGEDEDYKFTRNAETLRVAGHGVVVYLRRRLAGQQVLNPHVDHHVELAIVLKQGFVLPRSKMAIASSVHHFGTPELPADRKAKEHHPDFDVRYILPKHAVVPEGTAYTDNPNLHFVVSEPKVLVQKPNNLKYNWILNDPIPQPHGEAELCRMLDELLASFLPRSILEKMIAWATQPSEPTIL